MFSEYSLYLRAVKNLWFEKLPHYHTRSYNDPLFPNGQRTDNCQYGFCHYPGEPIANTV